MKKILTICVAISASLIAKSQIIKTAPIPPRTNPNIASTTINPFDRTKPVTVTPQPDLIIQSITVNHQDSIYQNDKWFRRYAIVYKVKNPGNADVDISQIQSHGNFIGKSGCAVITSGINTPKILTPGSVIDCIIGCTTEVDFLSTSPLYTLTVDATNAIVEKNENNNYAVIAIPATKN